MNYFKYLFTILAVFTLFQSMPVSGASTNLPYVLTKTYDQCMSDFAKTAPRKGSITLRMCMATCDNWQKRDAMINLVRKMRKNPNGGDPAFGIPGLFY